MKFDIYNFILLHMRKYLNFSSNNTKYNVNIVFDSLIYILKSGTNWNSNAYDVSLTLGSLRSQASP